MPRNNTKRAPRSAKKETQPAVSTSETATEATEATDLASRFGYDVDDFTVSDDEFADASSNDGGSSPDEIPSSLSEYAITPHDGDEFSATQDAPVDMVAEAAASAAKLPKPTPGNQPRRTTASSSNRTPRVVRSKGSEKADYLYELKRGREAVWYRLRKAGFIPARVSKGVAGFKLDTIADEGLIRVTHYSPALAHPSDSDPAYFKAVDDQVMKVDAYEKALGDSRFITHHASIDGVPFVVLLAEENPVTKAASASAEVSAEEPVGVANED